MIAFPICTFVQTRFPLKSWPGEQSTATEEIQHSSLYTVTLVYRQLSLSSAHLNSPLQGQGSQPTWGTSRQHWTKRWTSSDSSLCLHKSHTAKFRGNKSALLQWKAGSLTECEPNPELCSYWGDHRQEKAQAGGTIWTSLSHCEKCVNKLRTSLLSDKDHLFKRKD